MDRIKSLSDRVLGAHRQRFGEDFAGNKEVLNQVAVIRSKGLKNEVAGHITKVIKREAREEKRKVDRARAAREEEQRAKAELEAEGAGTDAPGAEEAGTDAPGTEQDAPGAEEAGTDAPAPRDADAGAAQA